MGRAERRKMERRNRIEERKGKVLLSRQDINDLKNEVTNSVSGYSVEALMTCFALAEHRLYGFGSKRILRTLHYIDDLMGDIIEDKRTIDDLKKELEEETGVAIKA